MYPYNLKDNPYPSSPTPTILDVKTLGGPRHNDAKKAVLNAIKDLSNKVSNERGANARDFRLITVIQDIGAGKTHLALHIKSTQIDSICSYVDLSTISPKNLDSLYTALIGGFSEEYIKQLKSALVGYIKGNALTGNRLAKKVFRPSFFGGKSIENLAEEVLKSKRIPDTNALNEFLTGKFSVNERIILKQVIFDDFKNTSNIHNLEEMLARLSAIATLNLRFLNKITLLEIDEFDANTDACDFVKAVINAHLPSTIMLLITTPSLYSDVKNVAPSVYDRLEKANYKIDLAGSNSFDEVSDIVLEYIRRNVKDLTFETYENDIARKVKVIYNEFQEFRSIRSMLNIMYHVMEIARKQNTDTITEEALDETIKQAYPGLRVRGSIMNVPISEFIKIRRDYIDSTILESNVKDAIKNLVVFAHEQGKVSKPERPIGQSDGTNVDTLYKDLSGSKVAVAVIIDKDHGKSIEKISNTDGMGADKLVVLTNAHTDGTDDTSVINIDKCKMIDLIYFNKKYKNDDIIDTDSDRVLMLAKSVLIC